MSRASLGIVLLTIALSGCAATPHALIDTVRADPDAGNRRDALLALDGRVASWMIPALESTLSSDLDTVCRALAAERLGQTQKPETAVELRKSTHTDKDVIVRKAALRALGLIAPDNIEPDLRKVLQEEPAADIRELALRLAHGVVFDPGKRKALARLASEDADLRVRRAAMILNSIPQEAGAKRGHR